MKGYGLLILLTALCLLLLPLPAFPFQSTAAAAPPKPQDSTSLDKSDATDEKNANQATFRILCDKQVVELDERDFLIRTLIITTTDFTVKRTSRARKPCLPLFLRTEFSA